VLSDTFQQFWTCLAHLRLSATETMVKIYDIFDFIFKCGFTFCGENAQYDTHKRTLDTLALGGST